MLCLQAIIKMLFLTFLKTYSSKWLHMNVISCPKSCSLKKYKYGHIHLS